MSHLGLLTKARLHNRSYWALLYTNGKIIEEPDCDWLHAPPRGRMAIRLYCPNFQFAELGGDSDRTDQIFQFKCAITQVGGGVGHATLSHVIGLVTDMKGNCTCARWDYQEKKIITFEDNVYDFKYHNVGVVYGYHQGSNF